MVTNGTLTPSKSSQAESSETPETDHDAAPDQAAQTQAGDHAASDTCKGPTTASCSGPRKSMNLFELKTDEQLEAQGVWIEYPDHINGRERAEFLIGSSSASAYRKALNIEVRKRFHRKWLEDIEGRDEAEIMAMSKAVLLGWRGAVYLEPAGEITPYSRAAAIKALHIPAFKTWVEAEANNLENFQRQEKAADEAALKSGPDLGAAV